MQQFYKKRWLTFFCLLSALLVSASGCTNESDDTDTSTHIDVGGYRLHLYCSGNGSPTVILESGLAEAGSSGSWTSVLGNVDDFTQVCYYDRAGLGKSEQGPKPRDSQSIARELHTLLHNAGIESPYLLTGHSMGGIHIRLFATQYPNEVDGLVFVDPTHENMPHLPEAIMIPIAIAEGATEGGLDEVMSYDESIDQVRASGNLPDVPVVVLSSGKDQSSQNIAVHKSLAAMVTSGTHRIVPESGHHIQVDCPEAVIEAIREVFNAAQNH